MLSLRLSNDKGRRENVASKPYDGQIVSLCDQHNAPMRLSDTHLLIFHGCTEDKACERRYDPSLGYYGDPSPTMTSHRVLCHAHFKALYLCAYDAHRDVRWYACPVQGCNNVTEWRS